MSQIELTSYIPETGSYQIWYPINFIVNEDEDGIVTITSPITKANLTLSGYQVNQVVTEAILLNFFDDTTKNYTSLSGVKRIVTDKRIWLEGDFKKDNKFWIWWALSTSNQIILASVNAEAKLDEADFNLFIFMLNKMEIYPEELDN